MIAMLSLEVITRPRRNGGRPGGTFRPWVARITGSDPTFGLAREFLPSLRDVSSATRNGRRGILLWFVMDDGVYEIKDSEGERYFARADQGVVVRMGEEETTTWLESLA